MSSAKGPLLIGLSSPGSDNEVVDVRTYTRPVLDLNYRTFDHMVEGIRVVGTWVFDKDPEPCLVLLHPRRSVPKCVPCIVRLSNIWKWEDYGDAKFNTEAERSVAADGAREVARLCLDFAPYLGMNPKNPKALFRILTAVRKRTYDLVKMPPPPLRPLTETGSYQITNVNTGKTMEGELTDEL
ncbi:hypothetical protein [uncultured Roseobacter sp.]|uniref:hypothetical protein n=1 Tax=uncultured Roseobacter sp. TaxID=114847 RepID=UPI00261D69A1|nr:hypothetical protein [uncultured Roseobacter sp.]